MPGKLAPKIQPWKALKTLDENRDPDFSKLQKFVSTEPTMGSSGASVSRPMDRKAVHEKKPATVSGSGTIQNEGPGKCK